MSLILLATITPQKLLNIFIDKAFFQTGFSQNSNVHSSLVYFYAFTFLPDRFIIQKKG